MTEPNSNIPSTLRELLKKLEFLGMIEEGKKPCMNEMIFVDAKSWWGAFYRNRSGENRKSTMLHIQQIVDQAILAMQEFDSTEFTTILTNSLLKARDGIEKLAETYLDSPGVVAETRVIVSNINLQLKRYQNQMKKNEKNT